MADEFQIGSGNWWDSPRTRHDNNSSPSSSTLSGMSFIQNTMDSHVSVSGSTSMVSDPNLQIIGLGLSSQPVSDWNQTLMRGGKAESSFQQESGMGSSTQDHWTHKLYSGSSEDSSINDYKQINPGLSLDQSQFSPQISSNNFQMDPNTAYGNTSTTFQGLLGLENQQQQSSSNYGYPPNYGETLSCWPKFPQFLGNSPPKQTPPNSQLQFSNSTQFWNPAAGPVNDVRSSFFPSSPSQFSSPNFEEKPKQNTPEGKDFSTVVKKNSCEASSKRPRNETPSPLPAFKVRKEKMGDRITALQQLVSPFGKTDTASVLSEAIEYIKFLHEQVGVLSNPYLKSGASMHHQQNIDKSKEPEGPKPDLRSRGLCLVPVSSTFPVTHETTVDFWTPTFGGTFR